MLISEIRKQANRTQEEMAVEVQVSVRTIAYWEKHKKSIRDLHRLPKASVESFARSHGVKLSEAK